MHVVLLWLERHAVTLLALFRVDEFGKRWVQVQVWQEVETSASYLLEHVMWLPANSNAPLSGSELRFQPGIFLGLIQRTSELIVGVPSRVYGAQTVKRTTPASILPRPATQ